MAEDNKIYRDFNINFELNPLTGDIGSVTDEHAINASIKNLVLTNFDERLFDSRVASGVPGLLFENASLLLEDEMESAIENVIENHEPRVEDLRVSVTDRSDKNQWIVRVVYRAKVSREPVVFDFFLRRVL